MTKFSGHEEVAKSYALRLLVHFIGDIVQPLHSMMRYNKNYTTGDSGANDFPLPNHYTIDNLHSLWDKLLYKERTNIARPFTADSWLKFQPKVDTVMKEHTGAVANTSVYQSVDTDAWA